MITTTSGTAEVSKLAQEIELSSDEAKSDDAISTLVVRVSLQERSFMPICSSGFREALDVKCYLRVSPENA